MLRQGGVYRTRRARLVRLQRSGERVEAVAYRVYLRMADEYPGVGRSRVPQLQGGARVFERQLVLAVFTVRARERKLLTYAACEVL